jgi:hypothetical protein
MSEELNVYKGILSYLGNSKMMRLNYEKFRGIPEKSISNETKYLYEW